MATRSNKTATANVAATAKLDAARAEYNERTAAKRAGMSIEDYRAAKVAVDVSPLKATVADAPQDELAGVWQELQTALAKVQKTYGIVSWKRYMCAMLLGSVVSFGVGYLLGWALDILVTSVFLSGYAFLGWMLLIVGVILAITAGAWLGRKAFHYVASEHIDEHAAVVAAAIKAPFRWIGSLFSGEAQHA